MKRYLLLSMVMIAFGLFSCHKDNNNQNNGPDTSDINNTYGYNVLNKLKGIWAGPVTSTTAIGSFTNWIVDFRAISENQVSAKNELDSLNDIFMSFFIVKYNNQYKVAFRNGGSFTALKRVSYFLADSVSETTGSSYYRFSEIIKGKNKAYSEVIFRSDSLYIRSYTNKYNTLPTATLHMSWSAKLQDSTSCQAATANFSFPKKTMTKDFSNSFTGMTESILYATSGIPAGDPYPENAQPYLGKTTATFSYIPAYVPDTTKKVLLIITTQPLFTGAMFNTNNVKYISRYVLLNPNSKGFTFNYFHPGNYYYYALYDKDGNNTISSGDWISTANTTFTLGALGTANTTTQINYTIP